MDIRQILAEVQAIDFEAITTVDGANQTEDQIQSRIDQINEIYQEIMNRRQEIRQRRWELETDERLERGRKAQEELAAQGLKVGMSSTKRDTRESTSSDRSTSTM